MPRQIEFAGAPAECKLLLERLHDHPGVARITLHSGASRVPQGDVLIIEAANQVAGEILNLFRELNLLHSGAVSISEPNATIRAQASQTISEEGNDAIWEETGAMMRQDTNPSFNFIALMGLSGAVAAFGIVSDTIHIVIGAMLIAPGFEPLLRVIFGVLGDRHSVTAGLRANAYGYLALAASAAAATPVALLLSGTTVDQLAAAHWANYWSRIQASGIATSLVAGLAGGIIVSSRMKVLGTGVMVALALIPAMALVGMGLATGLPHLMLGGASRWVAEVLCVLVGGGLIILLKRKLLFRHASEEQRFT